MPLQDSFWSEPGPGLPGHHWSVTPLDTFWQEQERETEKDLKGLKEKEKDLKEKEKDLKGIRLETMASSSAASSSSLLNDLKEKEMKGDVGDERPDV